MSEEQNQRGGGHRSTRGEPLFEPRGRPDRAVGRNPLAVTVLRVEQVPHRSGTRIGGFRALSDVLPRRLATARRPPSTWAGSRDRPCLGRAPDLAARLHSQCRPETRRVCVLRVRKRAPDRVVGRLASNDPSEGSPTDTLLRLLLPLLRSICASSRHAESRPGDPPTGPIRRAH